MRNSTVAWGVTMGMAAALIGGGWQVATRHATNHAVQPHDLVILRYCVPALILLPLVLKLGLIPPGVPRLPLAWMIIGAGLPFGLLAMTGTRFAPSAHMGVLMAGASPLIAAALAFLLWKERPDRHRMLGMVLMTIGVVLLLGKTLADWSPATWAGDLLFLLAALLWACYTLSFRRAGLTPWQSAALVNAWSALGVLIWVVARGGTSLFDAPLPDILWQGLWQGLLAGVLGLWTYTVAIERLGASNAAAFGALAPVVSAIGGWYLLGDPLTLLDALAVLAAVFGVALASGVITLKGATTP